MGFNFTQNAVEGWEHIVIWENDSRICTKFNDRGNGFALFELLSEEAQEGLLIALPEMLKLSAEDKEKGSSDGVKDSDLVDTFKERVNIRVAKVAEELAIKEAAEAAAKEK